MPRWKVVCTVSMVDDEQSIVVEAETEAAAVEKAQDAAWAAAHSDEPDDVNVVSVEQVG